MTRTEFTNEKDGVTCIMTRLEDGRYRLQIRDDDADQILPNSTFFPHDASPAFVTHTARRYAGLTLEGFNA